KGRLVQSHAERVRRIEAGELPVVGVNMFTETAPSPLVSGYDGGEAHILELDPAAEAEQIEHLAAWRGPPGRRVRGPALRPGGTTMSGRVPWSVCERWRPPTRI